MTFDQLPSGSMVFLDANTLVYHFSAHPKYGASCTRLVERIENQDVQGFTSAHVLGDVVHRLMTIEAISSLAWPATGIASRLRKHHDQIPTLTLYEQVPGKTCQLGLQVLPLTEASSLRGSRAVPAIRIAHGRRPCGCGHAGSTD
jgi:hypothetical protein